MCRVRPGVSGRHGPIPKIIECKEPKWGIANCLKKQRFVRSIGVGEKLRGFISAASTGAFVEVDGSRIYYEECGTGPNHCRIIYQPARTAARLPASTAG